MKIFLDESGYTGEDLMNTEQPWFVLTSTILNDTEANALAREFFGGVQAQELKHSKLRKTERGRRRVIECIKALKNLPNKVATSIAHKNYALVSMMVEWWVEPSMRTDGVNLYENGANLGLTNLMYITMLHLQGHQFLKNDLANFQAMMRDRTLESYNTFWRTLNLHFNSAEKAAQDLLVLTLYAEKRLGFKHLLKLPEKIMDIALPTAVVSVAHWRKNSEEPSEVLHDESSSMSREKWLWDQLVGPSVEAKTFAYNGRTMMFPIGVTSTRFLRSEDYLQLQIADIVAGSTAEWCKSKSTEQTSEYTEALEEAGVSQLIFDGLYPSKHVTPKELGTEGSDFNELLDFVSSRIIVPEGHNSD